MKRYFADPRDARPGTAVSAAGLASTIDTMQRTVHGPGVKRMGGHMFVSGNTGGGGAGSGGKESKLAKFASLNADGNTMEVYLWDTTTDTWATSTTTVYKPFELQAQYYDGLTHTYADGSTRTYSTSGLNKRYQRLASWNSGASTELQQITPPYRTSPEERLYIKRDAYGNLIEESSSKAWAAVVEQVA